LTKPRYQFISYAVWWIAGDPASAGRAVAHRAGPLNRAGTLHRIGKRSASLLQELGASRRSKRSPKGWTSPRKRSPRRCRSRRRICRSTPTHAGEDNKLLDYLPDTTNPGPDDEIFEHALTESIESVLATLKEREPESSGCTFGLEGQEPMTLEEIGSQLGITRERSGNSRRRRWRGFGTCPEPARWKASCPRSGRVDYPPYGLHDRLTFPRADLQEVDNAVNQAQKEIIRATTSKARRRRSRSIAQGDLTLIATTTSNESLFDVLQSKMIKRGVPVKNMESA